MSRYPRVVCQAANVQAVSGGKQIVKYMEFWKFQNFIRSSALYFRRIDKFEDIFEGTIPLAVWSLTNPEIKAWYDACKERLFVCCWNLDEDEKPRMWRDYAENYGVRISTTVDALAAELSQPPVPPRTPCSPEIEAWAARKGMQIAEVNDDPKDGFSMGTVKYIDFDHIDVHEMLQETLSNVTPAFRKRRTEYLHEQEYRVIMQAASASGEAAWSLGDDHVFVEVSLGNLIHEVRYVPSRDADLRTQIENLLASHGVTVPVMPSAIV